MHCWFIYFFIADLRIRNPVAAVVRGKPKKPMNHIIPAQLSPSENIPPNKTHTPKNVKNPPTIGLRFFCLTIAKPNNNMTTPSKTNILLKML